MTGLLSFIVIAGDSGAVATAADGVSCGARPRGGATDTQPKQTAFVSVKHSLMFYALQ